jgi:hypothetical protein
MWPDLVSATVRLGRALRARGVRVTPAEAIDAARALAEVDLGDRREVYLALRAVMVGRVEDYAKFDEAFGEVFLAGAGGAAGRGRGGAGERPAGRGERGATGRMRAPPVTLDRWLRRGADDAEPVGIPTVSDREVLAERDFSTFDAEALEELTRLARRLARRLAARPGRRWVVVRRRGRVDPRRTLRRSLRSGGEPVELAWRARRPRKTKLVVLCDVSGSMDLYSRFLLQFIYALQNCFARVESFVFSTRLSRVTDQLRGESYPGALDRLARSVHDWSGGTRIGASLAAFNESWPRLVDRRTIVVILSDGWDTGEPEELGDALRSLRRRAGRVIWLNPLLGSPDYRPLTRGMQAALPHVDVFASAHNLASLHALVPHLRL